MTLKYKKRWSAEQTAAAGRKVAQLNRAAARGDLTVADVKRAGSSAASRWRSAGRQIPDGADIDHTRDLQLNGADTLDNMGHWIGV